MIKPVYLHLSVLEISKTMFEFWCDYMKPKYQNNAKLWNIDTDSFIIHVKTEDNVKILPIMLNFFLRFNTSNNEIKAAVSWKFCHCSVHASLKIWWIIMH